MLFRSIVFNNLAISLNYDISSNTTLSTNTNTIPKNVVLNIINNDTSSVITYKISDIDYFKAYKNVIKMEIASQTIMNNTPNDTQTLQQLLTTLGIQLPTRLFISLEQFTSPEMITRNTYKLLNSNMDTIMLLEKTI